MTAGDGPRSLREWAEWILHTDHSVVVYARELITSALAVLAVGLLLFAISGLWPPMVAVESSSMEPHMQVGDLVFVMEEHRFSGEAAYGGTGVVTYRSGTQTGYSKFHEPGDVIVYRKGGSTTSTPIIHRAMFWVNESENWYAKGKAVSPEAVGSATNCGQLDNCPAPYDGFITKGDNPTTNRQYDQVSGLAPIVKPEWVVGTAEFRIPYLGNIRLWVSRGATPAGMAPVDVAAADVAAVDVAAVESTPPWAQNPSPRPFSPVEPKGSSVVDPVAATAAPPRCSLAGATA